MLNDAPVKPTDASTRPAIHRFGHIDRRCEWFENWGGALLVGGIRVTLDDASADLRQLSCALKNYCATHLIDDNLTSSMLTGLQ
jgi:hypothetical protein